MESTPPKLYKHKTVSNYLGVKINIKELKMGKYLTPPDEGVSGPLSTVGVVEKERLLEWVILGLAIGDDLSDVEIGEFISDGYDEFSATRKSSSSTSVQKVILII